MDEIDKKKYYNRLDLVLRIKALNVADGMRELDKFLEDPLGYGEV